MAITINQDPTSPNLANNDLVFSVSSNRTNQPQYQYVVDIKDASNTLIQRVKQQPNPSGYGVFNLSQIIKFNLGPTDKVWEITTSTLNTTCGDDFKIFFGEEYGTSVSSSVTLYTGNSDVTGSPANSGSANNSYYFMLDGHLNPNSAVNWNWASSSKYDEEIIDDLTFNYQNGLTAFDTQSIYLGDYGTISLFNGNLYGNVTQSQAQTVFAMEVEEFDITGSSLGTTTYFNEAVWGTPASSSVWFNLYNSQSAATRLNHWPVGPQNFADAGNALNANTSYYVCTFKSQGTDGNINPDGVWGTYTFNLADCSGFEPVRFAWKNQYGVWDYFNFTKAQNRNSGITRQSYEQSFVNYATSATTVSYDKARRGKTNYYNEVVKDRIANTDWLTQTDADNLRELFFSANVYVYDNASWIPVVITDASITEKVNPLSQKSFQYQVNYQHSNEVRPRL